MVAPLCLIKLNISLIYISLTDLEVMRPFTVEASARIVEKDD